MPTESLVSNILQLSFVINELQKRRYDQSTSSSLSNDYYQVCLNYICSACCNIFVIRHPARASTQRKWNTSTKKINSTPRKQYPGTKIKSMTRHWSPSLSLCFSNDESDDQTSFVEDEKLELKSQMSESTCTIDIDRDSVLNDTKIDDQGEISDMSVTENSD